MTDENEVLLEDNKVPLPDELTLLKQRAKQLGITHHPSIGVDKLRDKVNEKMQDAPAKDIEDSNAESLSPDTTKRETERQRRARLFKESSKLIRVRITNMNPNKKEWEGDIYTVSNSLVGTFKKYIPYDNEEGWHVPQIIVNHLKERQCQVFYTVKNSKGAKIRKGKLIRELAIEILPDLTNEELKDLAQRQAQAHSID